MLAAGERPASWHELVLAPTGAAKSNPIRSYRRRDERGQVVPDTGVLVKQDGTGHNRVYRRASYRSQAFHFGRLVQHRTRLKPVEDPRPRRSVLARRLRRADLLPNTSVRAQ